MPEFKKPDSLRAWLSESLPRLAKEPERLVILFDTGKLAAGGRQSSSFEYSYSLKVAFLDLPKGDHVQAMAAIIMWLARYQREILQARREIDVEADPLDDLTMDLVVTLPLSERVKVVRREDEGFDVEVLDEPNPADAPDPLAAPWPPYTVP